MIHLCEAGADLNCDGCRETQRLAKLVQKNLPASLAKGAPRSTFLSGNSEQLEA